jgi:Glycosyl hydrolase family 26
MNARSRYQIAFLSLGWLLLIGYLVHRSADSAMRSALDSASDTMARFSQKLSDREGTALEQMRRHSRHEELAWFTASGRSVPRLRKGDRMLFGAFDGDLPNSFEGVDRLEAALHYRFPIISTYVAWGDKPDEQFPLRTLDTIDRLGSVPMITWEPWVTDFDEARRTNLPPAKQREYASLAAIARGDYDFYVAPFATAAAQFRKPIFLRFAHEMNDPYRYPWGPQNGNRPDDFIAAWKHVHLIFQKMGATNVLWVWSPHISMPWFEYYYPGDEWVDWVGTGILNYGDAAPWSRWWTFHQILEKAYPALEKLGKPIMVTEFGTLAKGGDPAGWYAQAFADMKAKYPKIRSVIFFNQPRDVTLSTEPLDWSMLQSPRATAKVEAALRSSR